MTDRAPYPDPNGTDRELDGRTVTTAAVLAGLLALGLLDEVGQPQQLPTVRWPQMPADDVQTIWQSGIAVGYRAARAAAHRWPASALERAHAALADAGYSAMARTIRDAMAAAPSQHPADPDTARTHPEHR